MLDEEYEDWQRKRLVTDGSSTQFYRITMKIETIVNERRYVYLRKKCSNTHYYVKPSKFKWRPFENGIKYEGNWLNASAFHANCEENGKC